MQLHNYSYLLFYDYFVYKTYQICQLPVHYMHYAPKEILHSIKHDLLNKSARGREIAGII